jgi:hypothetical protein
MIQISDNETDNIFPNIKNNFVVDFIPILKINNSNYKPSELFQGFYIIKIIIKPSTIIHSVCKNKLSCYKRLKGQIIKLNAEEIEKEILNKLGPLANPINHTMEFDDPEPLNVNKVSEIFTVTNMKQELKVKIN